MKHQGRYSHGRVLRTQEFGAEAEVLSKLVAGRNREAQVLTRFRLETTMKPPRNHHETTKPTSDRKRFLRTHTTPRHIRPFVGSAHENSRIFCLYPRIFHDSSSILRACGAPRRAALACWSGVWCEVLSCVGVRLRFLALAARRQA